MREHVEHFLDETSAADALLQGIHFDEAEEIRFVEREAHLTDTRAQASKYSALREAALRRMAEQVTRPGSNAGGAGPWCRRDLRSSNKSGDSKPIGLIAHTCQVTSVTDIRRRLMKKTYVTPDVEKIAFQYRDQVVVASNLVINCGQTWYNEGEAANDCTPGPRVPDSGLA